MVIKNIVIEARRLFEPPPELTVSTWSDQYRYLSSESSSLPGKWDTSYAEYQRGMMDSICDSRVEIVTFMTSAQIGKTEILNNIIGYYVMYDAAPILIIQPTLSMAQSYSKDRLEPMLRDSHLTNLFDPVFKNKDKSNTILHKKFNGGHITMAGANSPASLASRPIRILLLDEVDRFPVSVGNEGDPVNIAIKRTSTFHNRKIIMVSTPTIRGASRIEQSFEESSKNYFYVPCKKCGEFQKLTFQYLKFDKENLKNTKYVCNKCDFEHVERDKHKMVLHGKWISENKNVMAHQGFNINELYSPWSTWGKIVKDFLEAKTRRETLKVWTNTTLGECFDEMETASIGLSQLINRVETYQNVPNEVLVLTAGVDVQDDRLHYLIKGWGDLDESWLIEYNIIIGSPALKSTWDKLLEILQKRFYKEDGTVLGIASAFIDSGGHFTQQVYDFCRKKIVNRIYACKGFSGFGRPIVSRPTYSGKNKNLLFQVGVDTAKELIYSRLHIEELGNSYMHFNKKYCDEAYFNELTAEKIVIKYNKGVASRNWVKIRVRNEALDCEVYALASFISLNVNFDKLKNVKEKEIQVIKKQEEIKKEENKNHQQNYLQHVINNRRKIKKWTIA